MPAPHTTATPQWGSARSGRPERKMAKVSFTTVAVGLQPWAWTAAACSASSSGRSALARQATVCIATQPEPSVRYRPVSWAAACLTTASRNSTVWSTPTSWALMPGPRAAASSVPSPATRATSVLLLPPSMASTAGLSSGGGVGGSSGLPEKDSAKASPAEGEREQRRGGVVVGGFDRRPRDHVVLVTDGGGVERRELARAARPHPGDRAQAGEVVDAARPVGGRAELDGAGPGQRAGQVGDLALHAVREHRARADHERASPRVRAQREVQLLLREGRERGRAAVLLVERVGDEQAERVRRGVRRAELGAERERVAARLVLAGPQLGGHVVQERGGSDRRLGSGRRGLHGRQQLGFGHRAVVVEGERGPGGPRPPGGV